MPKEHGSGVHLYLSIFAVRNDCNVYLFRLKYRERGRCFVVWTDNYPNIYNKKYRILEQSKKNVKRSFYFLQRDNVNRIKMLRLFDCKRKISNIIKVRRIMLQKTVATHQSGKSFSLHYRWKYCISVKKKTKGFPLIGAYRPHEWPSSVCTNWERGQLFQHLYL